MQTFTIEEAAALIANKYGWHEGAQDTLLEQLVDAAKAGMLTVRHPHTDLPYRPKQYREFYERVSASDLNRYFEGVGVPWRLYNDGETGDPISDTEWWNLMQVLAWVFLGDRSVVREAALPANERGHFFEEHIMPDGRQELVKVPVGRFTVMSLRVQQADRGSACYPALSMAENAIIEALKEGKLTAYGLKNGSGDLKEIPALSWADLKFWYEPDFAGPKDIFRHGATHWHNLRFQRKDVLAIWPDPLDQLDHRQSAEEQPATPAANPDTTSREEHTGTATSKHAAGIRDDQLKADRAHSEKRTDPATATREARKARRLGNLKRFIDGVYEAANQGDLDLGSGNDRKALPFSSGALRAAFLERHPEHDIEQATFNDDLPQISVKVKPGPKRMTIKYLRTMLAKRNQG